MAQENNSSRSASQDRLTTQEYTVSKKASHSSHKHLEEDMELDRNLLQDEFDIEER